MAGGMAGGVAAGIAIDVDGLFGRRLPLVAGVFHGETM
jgi:hypothetical protein